MIDFTDPNIQGTIIKASMTDLRTGKKYPLTEEKERSGGKSHCLFFKPIEIVVGNKTFSLKFRVDFSDPKINKSKDPVLGLEINGRKNLGKIHNTERELCKNGWTYDLRDKMVKIDGKNVPINYTFRLEMTKKQTISAKARIKK